jgi:hypothetical protein
MIHRMIDGVIMNCLGNYIVKVVVTHLAVFLSIHPVEVRYICLCS